MRPSAQEREEMEEEAERVRLEREARERELAEWQEDEEAELFSMEEPPVGRRVQELTHAEQLAMTLTRQSDERLLRELGQSDREMRGRLPRKGASQGADATGDAGDPHDL